MLVEITAKEIIIFDHKVRIGYNRNYYHYELSTPYMVTDISIFNKTGKVKTYKNVTIY